MQNVIFEWDSVADPKALAGVGAADGSQKFTSSRPSGTNTCQKFIFFWLNLIRFHIQLGELSLHMIGKDLQLKYTGMWKLMKIIQNEINFGRNSNDQNRQEVAKNFHSN